MTDLERIDAALIELRHLWTSPPRIEDASLGTVEMSTIWVVDSLRRQPDQTIAELANRMGVAHSTASRLVARAEAAEAVRRVPDEGDHRRVTVALTQAGAQLANTALTHRLRTLTRHTEDWSPQERTTFADLLTRFAQRKDHS